MPASSLNLTELCAFAFHKERVAARRLCKSAGITEEDALRQILQAAAAPNSIDAHLAVRRQTAAHAQDCLAQRRSEQAARRHVKALARVIDAQAWQGWFDGSATPNPGKMGIGALLQSPDGRQFSISRAVGDGDGNKAECLALIALLQRAVKEGAQTLVIFGDSQIVIDAVANSGSDQGFSDLRREAQSWMTKISVLRLYWIPRHKNSQADALSQDALK